MSANFVVNHRTITSNLAGPQLVSWPLLRTITQPFPVNFSIPRFRFHKALPIVNFVPAVSAGIAKVFVEIDPGVIAILTLTGHLLNGSDTFQVEQVGIKMETTGSRARADFIACSFTAMLGLAGQTTIAIPDANFSLSAQFEPNLLEISKMLERRLVAFRIMTIERATNVPFDLPKELRADEVETIALCYHAIVQKSFSWPIPFVSLFVPATVELLTRFRTLQNVNSISLGPDPHVVSLFNRQLNLGERTVVIPNAVIHNWVTIEHELAKNDGHNVTVVIRSKTHEGAYNFLNPPQLPSEPWDPLVQTLVDLESLLDRSFADGYNKLVFATLDGLNEDQRSQLTEPPTLDSIAFE